MRHILIALSLAVAVGAPPAIAASSGTLELRADALTVRDNGRVIEARGRVRITDGRSRITAEHALYAVRERRITLTGRVHIISSQGTLDAERAVIRLTADRRIETVEAAGRVAFQTGGRVLKADRVTYAVASESLTASGNVSFSMPPDLTATGQELTTQGRTAVLSGGAKVQTKDGSIQGDRMEFVEGDQVAHVRGHVVGVFADTRISAGSATLYGKDRKAVFRDGVTLTRPGRTVQAQVVTVYYQTKRIVAEGETNIRFDEEKRQP